MSQASNFIWHLFIKGFYFDIPFVYQINVMRMLYVWILRISYPRIVSILWNEYESIKQIVERAMVAPFFCLKHYIRYYMNINYWFNSRRVSLTLCSMSNSNYKYVYHYCFQCKITIRLNTFITIQDTIKRIKGV